MHEPPAHVYVLVCKDIPQPHLSVQAAHAAIAATHAFGEPRRTHPNLVICGIDDEPTLAAEFNRLKEAGVPCCAWYDEDMGGRLTAVASAPLRGNKARRPFKGYRLLGS